MIKKTVFLCIFLGTSALWGMATSKSFSESLLIALLQRKPREAMGFLEELIKARMPVNFRSKGTKSTPLMLASQHGYIEIVAKLLAVGADVNMQDEGKNTALMLATEGGYEKIVHILLAKGAGVNMINTEGKTAFLLAARGNHSNIGEMLLQNGAKTVQELERMELIDKLFQAILKNEHTDVSRLVKANPDIINATKNGNTPLMMAAELGFSGIVQILINLEADCIVKNKGKTAVDLAKTTEIKKIILKKLDFQLRQAACKGDATNLGDLLRAGANIDGQSDSGTTALINAAENGHSHVVKILLLMDAKINMQDCRGLTALIFAAQNGHVDIVRQLLAKGANVELQTHNSKRTALILAEEYGHTEIAQMLRDAGARN